ncbi:ATP-grasp domain-containing protein [Enorma massiliensis]|uniref:ATP-grasp domain-containing protein n=1 Tax=Enorma massiliensis TaxID=1472761 RepID=UPI003A8E7966
MMDKTVLLLGGSAQQLDAFDAAKRLGWRSVLCDWDPGCPGREHADAFYETSTLDREAVLEIARKEQVDGVVCFASDAPAPVAAWVSEQLGLPTNSYDSVAMLCDKGAFRQFLLDNGFPVPENTVLHEGDIGRAAEVIQHMPLPLVVKPVDSAGSRGVSVVRAEREILAAVSHAMEHSRKREVVVERYLETATPGRVIEAELFVESGRIVSWGLMSAFRDLGLNGLVPSCYVHPMIATHEEVSSVKSSLQRLVTAAGIAQGAMNVEIIQDAGGKLYVIDIGPRNGGNFLSSFISHASGGDIVTATLRVACGEPSGLAQFDGSTDGVWVQHIHYADKVGIFRGLRTTEEYDRARMESHFYKSIGSDVAPLSSIADSIGVSLLHFPGESDACALVSRLSQMCYALVSSPLN